VIFEILSCSMNDGPGIRTTVFFKGCPLDCLWCHNPESKRFERELFHFKERCRSCGACVAACPHGCHSIEDGEHVHDARSCVSCMRCVASCTRDALRPVGEEADVERIIDGLLRDKAYFDASGGGLTISGGEPLAQPTLCLALLKRARAEGIHTCIETSGYASKEVLLEIAAETDLFLYDYKATGCDAYRESCGVDDARILENLAALSAIGKPVVLRCPIVPGVNDTEAHLRRIAGLSNEHGSILGVDVLFYHDGGRAKSLRLAKDDARHPIYDAPTAEQRDRILVDLRRFGCRKLRNRSL
jgi:glycyl-radical enzyme activating protein